MTIRYYHDPETGQPHVFKHGLTEREVEDVLARPGEDRPANDGARSAIGRTRDGRVVRVIYVPEPGGVFVITAYELTGKPLTAYRRRKKKRKP